MRPSRGRAIAAMLTALLAASAGLPASAEKVESGILKTGNIINDDIRAGWADGKWTGGGDFWILVKVPRSANVAYMDLLAGRSLLGTPANATVMPNPLVLRTAAISVANDGATANPGGAVVVREANQIDPAFNNNDVFAFPLPSDFTTNPSDGSLAVEAFGGTAPPAQLYAGGSCQAVPCLGRLASDRQIRNDGNDVARAHMGEHTGVEIPGYAVKPTPLTYRIGNTAHVVFLEQLRSATVRCGGRNLSKSEDRPRSHALVPLPGVAMLSMGPHYSGTCGAGEAVSISATDQATSGQIYSRSFTAI